MISGPFPSTPLLDSQTFVSIGTLLKALSFPYAFTASNKDAHKRFPRIRLPSAYLSSLTAPPLDFPLQSVQVALGQLENRAANPV